MKPSTKLIRLIPNMKQKPKPSLFYWFSYNSILNFAKVADKIIAELITSDMSESKDNYQYGN